MNEMPPILAMQSVVDSTIIVPKLITALFDLLTSPSSELVLFDINRMDMLANLFNRGVLVHPFILIEFGLTPPIFRDLYFPKKAVPLPIIPLPNIKI